MLSDLRFACRHLAKSPGFAAIALLTLALGIGLNTAMFNIVNALALQPLRFPDSHRLFRLESWANQQRGFGFRPAHFVEIARTSGDFAEVACNRPWSFTLAEPGRPAEVIGSLRASAGYFHVLGLRMELGREFLPDEDKPGGNRVIVLSHRFWRSRFNGDPGVIGRTLRLDGQPNEIVGVASPLANDPRSLGTPDFYRPLALTAEEVADRVDHAYDIIGRLRPGVTAAQAEARLAAVAAGLAVSDPAEYQGRTLRAASLKPDLQGTARQIIFMLVGLSGFVLLIACANLANLLLARAIARAHEFAIRGALGASRLQLVRPLAAEALVLATAGGALGVLICVWTNAWLAAQFRASGLEIVFTLDWRLLLFAFAASVGTGLLFGLAPAWLASRVPVGETLKTGARGSTGDRSQSRFRQALIVGQFALALVLLSGAVFFVRGLDRLLRRDAGWKPESVLRGILSLPSSRYPDPASMLRFYEQVQARVAALPGVAAAAICYEVPAFYFPTGRGFIVEGSAPNTAVGSAINGVSPGYFGTIGTRLLRGRDFGPSDRMTSPRVIILSESMARWTFPGKEAVGQRLAYSDEGAPVWMEVVGVVEDVRFLNPGTAGANFQAYIPMAQATWSYVALCVRIAAPTTTLLEPIRLAVGAVDADLAVKDLMPVPVYIRNGMQSIAAVSRLLVGFALLGLFLAGLGIYGVIARLVAQRTHEIGIRMALGAQLGQIARLILGAGMRLVLGGVALGLVGAAALTRFLFSALPAFATSAIGGIALAAAILAAIALLACWLPARRATRINPLDALRAE